MNCQINTLSDGERRARIIPCRDMREVRARIKLLKGDPKIREIAAYVRYDGRRSWRSTISTGSDP